MVSQDVSVRAFEAAGDPDRYPDAGAPWQPLKLYYMGFWTKSRILALHDRAAGERRPFESAAASRRAVTFAAAPLV